LFFRRRSFTVGRPVKRRQSRDTIPALDSFINRSRVYRARALVARYRDRAECTQRAGVRTSWLVRTAATNCRYRRFSFRSRFIWLERTISLMSSTRARPFSRFVFSLFFYDRRRKNEPKSLDRPTRRSGSIIFAPTSRRPSGRHLTVPAERTTKRIWRNVVRRKKANRVQKRREKTARSATAVVSSPRSVSHSSLLRRPSSRKRTHFCRSIFTPVSSVHFEAT